MSDEPREQFGERQDDVRLSRLAGTDRIEDNVRPMSDDEIVREYETRYRPETADLGSKPKRKEMPRSYSTSRVSQEERRWAAVAHASAWLTLIGGVFTLGAVLPISVFVPLGIFLYFRKRSDFVAFHALQAFVLQLVGTIGAFLLLTVGGTVWTVGMIVAALLVLLLVGVILVPLWAIVGVVLLLGVVALPVAMLFYSVIAAFSTYNGEDYRYPFIARWVDRQLAGALMSAA